jgi:multidrug efflux pump subunit AcrB
VTDYQIYAGVASPFNFNGLVRHYFMRRGAPSVADIQVNLLPKHERKAQSHDIAKRVRPRVAAIAEKFGARVAVAEVPPGPPVLQTLVAEIYGPTRRPTRAGAEGRLRFFRTTEGVVDTDWYVEADQPKTRFVIDKEKAALHGISAETISQTLAIAVGGHVGGSAPRARGKGGREHRAGTAAVDAHHPEELLALRVRSGDANALPEPGVWPGAAAADSVAGVGDNWNDHHGQEHLSQKPDAGDLRDRRCGGRDRESGVCDSSDERGSSQVWR